MTIANLEHPETRFAAAGPHRVAYRMSGSGRHDVLMNPGLWSQLELIREDPGHVNFRRRLQSFSRFISFDCLGPGLSDRPTDGTAVEHWIARPGYIAGEPPEDIGKKREFMSRAWGRTGFPVPSALSQAGNAEFLRWNAVMQRAMASPEAVLEGLGELEKLDSRHVLSQIQVPTLVMARTGLAPEAFARAT